MKTSACAERFGLRDTSEEERSGLLRPINMPNAPSRLTNHSCLVEGVLIGVWLG